MKLETIDSVENKTIYQDIRNGLYIQDPFLANLLINIPFYLSKDLPTACITFLKTEYVIIFNNDFMLKLNELERIAIVKHEIYHLFFNHFKRLEELPQPVNMEYFNMAADIAINQYIDNLPKDCLFPKTFKFIDFQMTEYYYFNLLKSNNNQNKNLNGQQSQSNGQSNNKSNSIQSNSNQNSNEFNSSKIDEIMKKHKLVDTHVFDKQEKNDDLQESVLKKIINDAKNMTDESELSRGIGGSKMSYNFLFEKQQKKELDWKKVLKFFIDKTLNTNLKTTTWLKPNRRYEEQKGKKKIKETELFFAIDTSSSIPIDTIKKFVTQILLLPNNVYYKCCFFGDKLYYHFSMKDKKNKQKIFDNIKIIGATSFQPIFDYTKKNKIKNLVILTDAYGESQLTTYNINALWISKNFKSFVFLKKPETFSQDLIEIQRN